AAIPTLVPYTTLFRSPRLRRRRTRRRRAPRALVARPAPSHGGALRFVGALSADGPSAAAQIGTLAVTRSRADSLGSTTREDVARSEEHTSELQSPYDL